MTRLYKGLVMAAIVLSAGIIGQLEEDGMKQEIHSENLQQVDQAGGDNHSPDQRTTVARLD